MRLPLKITPYHCMFLNAYRVWRWTRDSDCACMWRVRLKEASREEWSRELRVCFRDNARNMAAEARLSYDMMVEEVLADAGRI